MHRHNLHNCFRFICCICCVQCYVEQISQFTLNKCIAACPPTSATFEKKSYIWSGRLPFEAKRKNLWKFIKQLHLIFFFYNLVAIELCNMSEFSYVVEWTQKVPGEKSVTPINTVYALGYILEIYLKKKKTNFSNRLRRQHFFSRNTNWKFKEFTASMLFLCNWVQMDILLNYAFFYCRTAVVRRFKVMVTRPYALLFFHARKFTFEECR